MERIKPAFLGIGAQKCASSWVYRVLSDHPEVLVTEPKELDFFSCFYDRGFQWYENYFQALEAGKICGEISPSYFPDQDAPLRAWHYNPKFKVILALRDPVERAYSNHLHDVRLEHLALENCTFEAGLENNPMYVEQGRYATHLQRWLDVFPREQMLILLQEDVQQNPESEARRVYQFLGISDQHQSEFSGQKVNESYLPKSRKQEALFQKLGKTLNKMGLEPIAHNLRNTALYQKIKSRNRNDIREIVPPMLEITRAKLIKELDSEVQKMKELLHRDTLPWKNWRN